VGQEFICLEQAVLEAQAVAVLAVLLAQVRARLVHRVLQTRAEAEAERQAVQAQERVVTAVPVLSLFATLALNEHLVAQSHRPVDTQSTPSLHLAHTLPNQLFKEQSTWHISQK
jgi:hypothetical protein